MRTANNKTRVQHTCKCSIFIHYNMALQDRYLDERFTVTGAALPLLPFFHTCDAFYLQQILDAGELRPRLCDVYKEPLLYLFYGRPAYKSGERQNSRYPFLMPMCFIVNSDVVRSMKRLLPFDSGAFHRYKDFMHGAMTLDQFRLTPVLDSCDKVVNFCYGNNDAYFMSNAKKEIIYDQAHFQLTSYHSIISSEHKMDLDDRKASLEAQLEVPIAINNINIEAIILPKMLADSEEFKCIITDRLNIKMIPYDNFGVVASLYYVEILQLARQYMIDKKLLNGS
jgi:hypothetical protein